MFDVFFHFAITAFSKLLENIRVAFEEGLTKRFIRGFLVVLKDCAGYLSRDVTSRLASRITALTLRPRWPRVDLGISKSCLLCDESIEKLRCRRLDQKVARTKGCDAKIAVRQGPRKSMIDLPEK